MVMHGVVCTMLFASSAGAIPEDADMPIHIEGDSFRMDQQREQLFYAGAVTVNQGTLNVWADEVEVTYKGDVVVQIIAIGKPARYRQQLEDNEGEVHANADRIIYHTQAERLNLQGDAYLNQPGTELKGQFIDYDIVKGRVHAHGSERISMTLEPKKKDDKQAE